MPAFPVAARILLYRIWRYAPPAATWPASSGTRRHGQPVRRLRDDRLSATCVTGRRHVAIAPTIRRRGHTYHFAGAIAARLAIAGNLARPLAKLAPEDHTFIDHVLAEALNRNVVFGGA